MKPLYTPKGAAAEYGDYAINIYTGCPHRCYYCFAPSVLRKDREIFHSVVEPRRDIVKELEKQLDREKITDKLVHLCFTCDPYPVGHDSTTTREVIKVLKAAGNHVQILTKNGYGAMCDFNLLDNKDWFGVTIAGTERQQKQGEPGAGSIVHRLIALGEAHLRGINTWVSFEPVLDAEEVYGYIKYLRHHADKIKIGKLNYHPSDINWAEFGRKAEKLCKEYGRDCYIKDSLRKEMEATP